jgi:Tol biopolymer transport system component
LATTPGLGGIVLTQFDVSDNGTLVYAPAPRTQPPDQLLWVDKNGDETLIVEGDGTWVHPRLSPDGARISIDIHAPTGIRDIYIYELERGSFRQLTRTGMTWESEWSPDGERLAILSGDPAGEWSLFWVRTDFSGPPEILHHSSHAIPGRWLPGGESLLFSEWVEGGIWKLSPGGDREPTLVLDTSAEEGFPRVSPDGNWIAFVERESGRREVFVQAFPVAGPKYKISIEGGGEPVWANNGSKLFFSRPDTNQMFVVAVDYEPSIRFDPPRLLFTGDYDMAKVGHQHYDISRNDRRFLMVRHGEPDGPSEVRVVLNWFEELDGG